MQNQNTVPTPKLVNIHARYGCNLHVVSIKATLPSPICVIVLHTVMYYCFTILLLCYTQCPAGLIGNGKECADDSDSDGVPDTLLTKGCDANKHCNKVRQ